MSNFGQSQYHHPQVSFDSHWSYPPPGLAQHHAMHHSSSSYFPPSSIPSFQPVHNPYPPEYQSPIYPYRSVPWPQQEMRPSCQPPAYHPPPQRVHSWPAALHHTPAPVHYQPPPGTPISTNVQNQAGAAPSLSHQQSQSSDHIGPISQAHPTLDRTPTSSQIPSTPSFFGPPPSSLKSSTITVPTSSIPHPSAFHRVDSTPFLGPFTVPPPDSFVDPSLVPQTITTSDQQQQGRRGRIRPVAKERTEEQKARARESSRAYRERKMMGISMNRKELDQELGKRQRYAMMSAKVAITREMEKEEEEYRPSHKGTTSNGPRRRSARAVASGNRPEYREHGGTF